MGNEPNDICGIVTVGDDAWAVVGLNGVKLKTGGTVDEEAEGGGGGDEATPVGGACAKMI